MSDPKKPSADEKGVPDRMLPAESVDESGSPLVEGGQTGAGAGSDAKEKPTGNASRE